MKAAQLAVLFTLAAVLGWSRLRLVILIALAVIAIGIVFQVLGDYQVAHSIWRTSGNPGFGNGYVAGHDRSGFVDLLVLVGGLAFAVTADVGRLVPPSSAIVGALLLASRSTPLNRGVTDLPDCFSKTAFRRPDVLTRVLGATRSIRNTYRELHVSCAFGGIRTANLLIRSISHTRYPVVSERVTE